MEISMEQLMSLGVHRPVAAAIAEGCERIKKIDKCWQVTIPTLIQKGNFLLQDRSHTLHQGVVSLATDKDLCRRVIHFLWQRGVQLHMHGQHAIALYDKSFEDEFISSSNCFHVDREEKVCRSVDTQTFLRFIVGRAKCGLHGFMSASAVAHGIRHAIG